ncbi:YtxH domain-containing protein [Euhalothece natronophila Z-M001]|uniref:YtxH domain-containing protein n=1 Tax=Euhalothece natronophila Z-M001 TaxID=522448 RepID=A0A5B8NQC7_9CHRO|nr:YtxH domain-containing protein [Euhalothece natronophila]QDZ41462.1 YtxH domain-containing protein [Euhalothece natronophila Z-M001]
MSKRGISAFIGGLALGSAVGSAIGLLVAPRSGQETRKILKKSALAVPEIAQDISSSVQLQADRFSETTLSNWESTLTRLQEAIAAGVEASKMETTSSEQTTESLSTKSE